MLCLGYTHDKKTRMGALNLTLTHFDQKKSNRSTINNQQLPTISQHYTTKSQEKLQK